MKNSFIDHESGIDFVDKPFEDRAGSIIKSAINVSKKGSYDI